MFAWFLALVPGSVALLSMTAAYALVTPACATHRMVWLHALHAAVVLLNAAFAIAAWRAWRRRENVPGTDAAMIDAGPARFAAAVAVGCGAIFTLLPLAQWAVVVVLSPCDG